MQFEVKTLHTDALSSIPALLSDGEGNVKFYREEFECGLGPEEIRGNDGSGPEETCSGGGFGPEETCSSGGFGPKETCSIGEVGPEETRSSCAFAPEETGSVETSRSGFGPHGFWGDFGFDFVPSAFGL